MQKSGKGGFGHRGLRSVFYALLLIPLAYLIVRDGIAAHLVDSGDYASALAIRSRSAEANSLAAESEYAAGRIDAAERHAAAALAAAPLNAAAARVLAISRFQLGQAQNGAAALRLAGMLGWRDTPTQVLLLVDAVSRRDVVTAAQRADALARRGREMPAAAAGLRSVLLLPGGVDAVAERLGRSPDYRLEFLRSVDKLAPKDFAAQEALFAKLKEGIAPPQPTEVDPYVKMLIARGEYGRARQAWANWQAAGANPADLLQDGDFDNVAVGSNGFGWQIAPEQASAVEVRSDVVPGRRVLAVSTDGSRTAQLIEQLLVLPPGGHVFAVNVAYASAAAKDAFQWSVLCLPGGRAIAATTRLAAASGDWQRLELAFEVPAEGCRMQVLHLDTRSIDLPPPDLSASFDRPKIH